MKKSTMILGVVSATLFFIGIIFRIQHWAGAGVAIILSGALFVFGYTLMLYLDRNKVAQNSDQKFVNLATSLAMIIIMISFVFKFEHWPGSGFAIYVAHGCLIAMIPILFIHASKEADPVKKMNFNHEAILLVILTAFSIYIWLRTSEMNDLLLR
jgi:hypothetical protein